MIGRAVDRNRTLIWPVYCFSSLSINGSVDNSFGCVGTFSLEVTENKLLPLLEKNCSWAYVFVSNTLLLSIYTTQYTQTCSPFKTQYILVYTWQKFYVKFVAIQRGFFPLFLPIWHQLMGPDLCLWDDVIQQELRRPLSWQNSRGTIGHKTTIYRSLLMIALASD